jgi:hypothetical protein
VTTKYTGKDMVVRYGTLSVAGQGRNLQVQETAAEIDVTTYGSTDEEFIVGLVDRQGSLDILDGNDPSNAIRAAFTTGTANSMTWFPIGTASGNPKFSCGTVLIKGSTKSYPYDGAVLLNVSLRFSGPVTEATAP